MACPGNSPPVTIQVDEGDHCRWNPLDSGAGLCTLIGDLR